MRLIDSIGRKLCFQRNPSILNLNTKPEPQNRARSPEAGDLSRNARWQSAKSTSVQGLVTTTSPAGAVGCMASWAGEELRACLAPSSLALQLVALIDMLLLFSFANSCILSNFPYVLQGQRSAGGMGDTASPCKPQVHARLKCSCNVT